MGRERDVGGPQDVKEKIGERETHKKRKGGQEQGGGNVEKRWEKMF